MPDNGPVVVEIGRDAYATRVEAGTHRFVVDEPGALGGADTGPDPYGLLLAAMGSCVVITVRMYADRKGWALDAVRAELTHERRSPGDETVRMRLRFDGALSAEQKQRLGTIAGMCPVKRTVTGQLGVEMVME